MTRAATFRAGVTGLFALVLTFWLPTAFSNQHHAAGSGSGVGSGAASATHAEPEERIPGLTRAALVDRAHKLLAHAVVSTDPFDTSATKQGPSKRTFVDNTQDKTPAMNGSISITFNPDGTVWMVDCDATTPHPDDSVVLRFCTQLAYTGANPPAISGWVHTTFAKPVNGLSLQQRRSQATWILSIDNFGDGLKFGINIQPTY